MMLVGSDNGLLIRARNLTPKIPDGFMIFHAILLNGR
jgi:hypothetical protein